MKIPDQARRASLLKLAGLAAAGWLLPQKAFAGRYRLTQTIDDRLRLEPFGPSDAAIMPFEITVGSGGKSTRQVVLIPSRQYRAIVALLEKSVPAGGTP